MSYLVAYYGIWLSSAFAIGALTAFACLRKHEAEDAQALRPFDFVFALWALLFVAFIQVTLGRIALYFESAVLVFVAFMAGVGLVVACFGKISRDRIGWRIGVASVAVVWLAANLDAARSLERDLKHKLGSLVARAGGDALDFEVSGRDVFLPVEMPDRFALADGIRRAAGVRVVWQVDSLSPYAAELRKATIVSEAAKRAGYRIGEAAWVQRQQRGAEAAAVAAQPADAREARSKSPADQMAEGRSANRLAAATVEAPLAPAVPVPPIVWSAPLDPTLPTHVAPEKSEQPKPAAKVSEAGPSGDDSSCRSAVSRAIASERIRFDVASASLRSAAHPVLDSLAGLLKRCPDVALEIGGHADAQGAMEENRWLSLRRAQSVADYLGRIGVERRRLTSIGYGVDRPLIADDSPESRAENRRVEFAVK